VTAAGQGDREAVPSETVDGVLKGRSPLLMKIDVEGFETKVVDGASRTLANPQLAALIIELGGLGAQYGFDESTLHARLVGLGFTAWHYDPLRRLLTPREIGAAVPGNIIYVRDAALVRERLASAPTHEVSGRPI
jgi:hypothetical protein